MPLGKNADAGDYVKDFQKSKAPQFKGKSKKKRQQMAIAAYLDSKEQKESKMKTFDQIRGNLQEKKVDEISSNKLGDYMTKSAADAAKRGPEQSARRQDKRISGQSMADKKIRKKMGYSSDAKVPAGTNEAAGDCPDGQYYCQRTLTCKPIPKGMKKNDNGFLVKESTHSADKKPEKFVGPDGKTKIRMVPVDKEVIAKEDKASDRAALQKAMDIYKKRGGKVTKVAPGKAAGYHGKDDPGSDMHGMMDKGDTKDMPKKKYMGSMK